MGHELMKNSLDSITSKSHDVACKALERIEELGLLPSPENYELWYKYYDGDAELVGAIDKLGDNINEANCTKLYKRYLTSSSHEDAVRKISDQIQQAITEIGGLFKSVKSATDEYGETLDDTADRIEQADTIQDLETAVTEMVQSTKKMVEHNRSLESQLNNTSGQMAELRQNLDTVRKEAMTDGLTGLSNRKAFDKYLETAIKECTEDESTLTLLMMDIDHFKAFNDTYGHLIGDQVLRLVARSLKDGIKGRDVASRYGGEEFAIILPETTAESGVVVGNLLRRAVERKEVINRTTGETLGQITLSVGVAEYRPGEKADEFVTRADQALYAAKEAGRNQVMAAE